jgi:aryl-alcohol dehydrogenase-like predicted oxidoreductase
MDANRMGRIGLGTVQWGLDYGVANHGGRPSGDVVKDILRDAFQVGANLLDTAAAYGEAEEVIGGLRQADAFEVVTKTLPYDPDAEGGRARIELVLQGFERSLSRLQRDKVYGLLVHHCDELLAAHGPELWSRLAQLKDEGRVGRIGVSVYEPEQLQRLLESFPVDMVQLPFNVFDQRFLRTGLFDRLHHAGVEIHVRSAFLQGVALMPEGALPPFLSELAPIHADWRRETAATGMSFVGGALGFCLQHPAVSRVIVGCDTVEQAAMLFNATVEEYLELPDIERFDTRDRKLIDPRKWPPRS